jgi:hypothetical protein
MFPQELGPFSGEVGFSLGKNHVEEEFKLLWEQFELFFFSRTMISLGRKNFFSF